MVSACDLSWTLGVSQLSSNFDSARSVFWAIFILEEDVWFVFPLDRVLMLLNPSFCILPVGDAESSHARSCTGPLVLAEWVLPVLMVGRLSTCFMKASRVSLLAENDPGPRVSPSMFNTFVEVEDVYRFVARVPYQVFDRL